MSFLNTPIQVGKTLLPNRLVMPPMATARSTEQGEVTDDLCRYYAQRAQGGFVGLIITEHCYVSPEGKARPGQMSISRDSDIPGLTELAKAIHSAGGSRVFAQISHAGAAARREVTGLAPIGPSALLFAGPTPNGITFADETAEGERPRAMTGEDIARVTADFASAARRAKEAGFDGVEIHSAHAYLLNQFYSPLTNLRTDAYGGAGLEGRLRLHLEVLRAVRVAVGPDLPIALRLGACDYMPGGTTAQESAEAAALLEAAGLDLLDISGGLCSYTCPDTDAPGYFAPLSRAAKGRVGIPVLLTGGVKDPFAAERLLEEGSADLIGVGRPLMQDAAFAQKAMEVLGKG